MIAFYVQGGGLGHLSRTHKLIQYLEIDSNEVLIITPSAFKHHFKQYRFIALSWHSSPATWSDILIQQLTNNSIQTCYIDAFPLGIKGELVAVYKALPKTSFVYTCRVLKWKKYLNDMPDAFTPNFIKTIILENICENMLSWIKTTTQRIDTVSLPLITIKKHIVLSKEPYALLIHSGGLEDVIALCKKVKATMQPSIKTVFVFTQVSVAFDDERFHFRTQEYAIEQYFKNASHIYTAGGFNLVHELVLYHKKHTLFPIERLYDNQFFRVENRATLLMK